MFHPRSYNITQKPGSSVCIISLEIPLGKTFNTMLPVTVSLRFYVLISDFIEGTIFKYWIGRHIFIKKHNAFPTRKQSTVREWMQRFIVQNEEPRNRCTKILLTELWKRYKGSQQYVWISPTMTVKEMEGRSLASYLSTYITKKNSTGTLKQKHKAKSRRFNMTTKEKIHSWFIDGHLVSIKW